MGLSVGAALLQAGEGSAQPGQADGLVEAVVHTGGQAEFPLARCGVGGKAPDRLGVAAGAQAAGQLETIHQRHLAVGDDEIEVLALAGLQRLGAVAAHAHLVAQVLELLAQQHLVGVVVVHHQHPQPGWRERPGGGHKQWPGLR